MAAQSAAVLLGVAASTPAAPAVHKSKVLLLHGYAQCGQVLRSRSGGFRRAFKKSLYDVHFPDGPYELDESARRSWWHGTSATEEYEGWSESRQQLDALWERESYDGVVGFSQGAAAAAMICAHHRPKFAIFVAGFVPKDVRAATQLLEGVHGVPSLHIYGLQDELVTPDRSRSLAALFEDAVTLEHEGGHMIPSGASIRQSVAAFLETTDC